MIRRIIFFVSIVAIFALFNCAVIDAVEANSVATDNKEFMVVAADVRAAQAGQKILQKGGSALDALVAVQMVLTLVEPQASGIGGGAFLLYWDNHRKKLHAYDGRERAPAAARADRFLLPDGKPQAFYQAVVGGRSVGVPGVVHMLEMAHRKHGQRPWKDLFQPAIHLSQTGFKSSPRLKKMLRDDRFLKNSSVTRDYFFDTTGIPRETLTNPQLAETLRKIAEHGSAIFYQGEIAQAIVDTVVNATPAGDLTRQDLADYRARERKPLCRNYRIHEVCAMPPPTSGGIAVQQILGLLEPFDTQGHRPDSAEMIHLFSQAQRLAFADRNHYVADSDHVPVPINGLLDRGYLAQRAGLIDLNRDMGRAEPGRPPGALPTSWQKGHDGARPSTSHISIVDGMGNIVSMTSSVENYFGSRLMVRGFILNNQLTDFSFLFEKEGKPVANRVQPGKCPRSSMSPVIVFDAQQQPRIVAGSPGGSRIIGYVARTLWTMLNWGIDPKVITWPNFGNRNGVTELETGTDLVAHKAALQAMGHTVKMHPMVSGLNVITIDPAGGLYGMADPRREGVVRDNRSPLPATTQK